MKRVDAGLLAVARVRDVRERDSRTGLHQAMGELRAHEERAATLRSQLAELAGPQQTTTNDFLQTRALAGLGSQLVVEARNDVASAQVFAGAARAHWSADAARLSAVELLLERRAAARAAEEQRQEAQRLDEAATQGWLRARNGGLA